MTDLDNQIYVTEFYNIPLNLAETVLVRPGLENYNIIMASIQTHLLVSLIMVYKQLLLDFPAYVGAEN